MTGMNHPYTSQPKSSFWKTAIARIDPLNIEQLWKPKFPIRRELKIITVGSCFAQHISSALKQNGFNWIDSEPAPSELPQDEHGANGYSIFSFRTGNIYTPALLKQWVKWATGELDPSAEVFVDESSGQYFDPFRPAIPVAGYASEKALFAARKKTLQAIAKAIQSADIFIFTLGLTEAWRNINGDIYPMCPGTVRGKFSPELHKFHNYSEQEVVQDLVAAFEEMRRLNPELKFLLTVSPVPLTATATNDHILTASTYSKSVLRSAAGYLCQEKDYIDYFPSYELIASPPYRARFFEANMRSVTSEGVSFVMSKFFKAIGAPIVGEATSKITLAPPETTQVEKPEKAKSTEDICEDIILENWSNKSTDDAEEPPNILLIGDSQMAMIAKVLDEQNIRYAGGGIMNASEWYTSKFELRNDRFLFDTNGKESDIRWAQVCDNFLAKLDPKAVNSTLVVTNIGTHTSIPMVSGEFDSYIKEIMGTFINRLSNHLLWGFLLKSRIKHLMLLRKLADVGYKVVWVTDPPTQETLLELFEAFDKILCQIFSETGCSVFFAREWISTLGGLPQSFRSLEIDAQTNRPDWIHASPEYYRQLMAEIFSRQSITPQYRHGSKSLKLQAK